MLEKHSEVFYSLNHHCAGRLDKRIISEQISAKRYQFTIQRKRKQTPK